MRRLVEDELLHACSTFPNHTGLGWDRWHPKVLLRLPRSTLQMLVILLAQCEEEGKWPQTMALVLIALLPKGDGEFRTIGLIPTMARIWMRARRAVATPQPRQDPSGGTGAPKPGLPHEPADLQLSHVADDRKSIIAIYT